MQAVHAYLYNKTKKQKSFRNLNKLISNFTILSIEREKSKHCCAMNHHHHYGSLFVFFSFLYRFENVTQHSTAIAILNKKICYLHNTIHCLLNRFVGNIATVAFAIFIHHYIHIQMKSV